MSPRGANLRKGSPQRAKDDALIKARWLAKQQPAAPEPEELAEDPRLPSKAERLRGSHAMKAVRASLWARPAISAGGELVARELPDQYFLDWEDREDVIAAEAPSFKSWRIVGTSLGPAFAEPGRLPSLIDEDELPEAWFIPAGGGGGNEAVLVIDTTLVD